MNQLGLFGGSEGPDGSSLGYALGRFPEDLMRKVIGPPGAERIEGDELIGWYNDYEDGGLWTCLWMQNSNELRFVISDQVIPTVSHHAHCPKWLRALSEIGGAATFIRRLRVQATEAMLNTYNRFHLIVPNDAESAGLMEAAAFSRVLDLSIRLAGQAERIESVPQGLLVASLSGLILSHSLDGLWEIEVERHFGQFRADITVLWDGQPMRIGEVDSRTYHEKEPAFSRDRARDRWIAEHFGVETTRFTAGEVNGDAYRCALQLFGSAERRQEVVEAVNHLQQAQGPR